MWWVQSYQSKCYLNERGNIRIKIRIKILMIHISLILFFKVNALNVELQSWINVNYFHVSCSLSAFLEKHNYLEKWKTRSMIYMWIKKEGTSIFYLCTIKMIHSISILRNIYSVHSLTKKTDLKKGSTQIRVCFLDSKYFDWKKERAMLQY